MAAVETTGELGAVQAEALEAFKTFFKPLEVHARVLARAGTRREKSE